MTGSQLPSRDNLSRRALSFISGHGHRLSVEQARRSAEIWLAQGADQDLVDRAVEYERLWGGLLLPPSVGYNGGPKYLGADIHMDTWSADGYFEAGPARFSVSYDFLIDPEGRIGIGDVGFVALYESVEDWIESLALDYELRRVSKVVRRVEASEIPSLGADDMIVVPDVTGISDTWRIGADQIIFWCRGIGLLFGYPEDEFAIVYSGVPSEYMPSGSSL